MTKKSILTGRDYQIIRQELGLSIEEACKFHNLKSSATITRWETEKTAPTEKATNKILDLYQKINWTIIQAVEQYKNSPKDTEIVLIIYPDECYKKFVVGIGDLPNSIHKTMITRLYNELLKLGANVKIVVFNPQDYFIFLASNGLEDSQDTRGMWATDYLNRVEIN